MLIRPSPLGAVLVGTIHALAACAVYVSLPEFPALVCAAGIALSAGVHVSRALHWSRKAVRELVLRLDGRADWRDGGGAWHAGVEVTGGVLAPWLIVVGLKDRARGLRPVLLLPDALEGEALRELGVWLRWRPTPRRPARFGVIRAMRDAKEPDSN